MMTDANDDRLEWTSKTFQNFIDELQLVDPLHQKFGQDAMTPVTYARGSKRLDYIRLVRWFYMRIATRIT